MSGTKLFSESASSGAEWQVQTYSEPAWISSEAEWQAHHSSQPVSFNRMTSKNIF